MSTSTKQAEYIVPTKKKTIASILNHMMRAFTLPEAMVATKVCISDMKDIKFDFIAEESSWKLNPTLLKDDAKFQTFDVRIKKLWDLIQSTKPEKYNYTWNAAKIEKDHVIEVQHIVKMLTYANKITETGWATLPLATIVHLSFYLNDQRNLWAIPKAFNQAKGYIPLFGWYGPGIPAYIKAKRTGSAWENLQCAIAKEYLFSFCTADGRTPFTGLCNLAAEMAGLQRNTMTWLTVDAGRELLALIQSWTGQIIGITDKDVQDTKKTYDLETPVNEPTAKRRRVEQRAQQGLGLFASDVAHTATTMTYTIAIQTDPLPAGPQVDINADGPPDYVDEAV